MTAHAETTNLWPKTAISANTGPSGKNSALCGILPVKSLTYSGKSWSDQGKFWNLHALCLSVTGSREGAANSWTPAKDSFAFFRNFINQEKTNFSATAGLKHLKQGQPGISWKRQVDLEKPAQQVCFKWLVLTSAGKKKKLHNCPRSGLSSCLSLWLWFKLLGFVLWLTEKQPHLAEEFRSDVNGNEMIQWKKKQRIHETGWVEDGIAATTSLLKTVISP